MSSCTAPVFILTVLSTSIIMDPTSFTFLATILILVLLSASLVLRSYIVRRRYRRRFQRALSDTLFVDFNRGTFNGVSQFDPLGLHRSTRRVGPKPVMWDTWIHAVDVDSWSSCTVSWPPLPHPSRNNTPGDRIVISQPILTARCCAPHLPISAIDIGILAPAIYNATRLFVFAEYIRHTRPTPSPRSPLPYIHSLLAQTSTHPCWISRSFQCPIATPTSTDIFR